MGLIAQFRTPEYRNLPTWMTHTRQTAWAAKGGAAHVLVLAVAASPSPH